MTSLACPQCNSTRLFKNGKRKLRTGEKIQTYICRECGYRFSKPRPLQVSPEGRLSSVVGISVGNQILRIKEAKNLEPQQQSKVAGEISEADIKGKIVEYSWWLKKEGYSESTIISRSKLLRIMAKRGANIYDPESVKSTIAKQTWSLGRKANAVDAYTTFLKMIGGKWQPPRYEGIHKIPFIPTENELDQLISGCSNRMATFLQLLKETGARCGEAWQLKWIDFDPVTKTIAITPEKGSNPRLVKLSQKLVNMLDKLPTPWRQDFFRPL